MHSKFSWRPAALLCAFLAGVGHRAPTSEPPLVWWPCAGAVEVGGKIVCPHELMLALATCEVATKERLEVLPGDALVCDAQRGWQKAGRASSLVIEALQLKVELNRASREELMTLPFVGEKRATTLIEQREWRSWAQLDQLRGVGPRHLAALRGRALVTGDLVACIGVEQWAAWCQTCRTMPLPDL